MANLQYQNQGTPLVWMDSGADYALTFKGLASGAGRQGAGHDFGVAAVAGRFAWQAMVHFDTATAPVVGELVSFYLKTAPDGTNYDNDDGTGDIAVSAENKLKNLHFLGSIEVDEAAVDVPMQASGIIIVAAQIVMPVIWNGTADTLDDDTAPTNSFFKLIPYPWELQ